MFDCTAPFASRLATALATGAALALSCILVSSATALPPGYVYEMVSPPEKLGGAAGGGLMVGGSVSSDGERVSFVSGNAFGDTVGGGLNYWYGAVREETGWQTSSMMPRWTAETSGFGDSPITTPASEDMTKVLTCTNVDPITGERQSRRNLYLRDNVTRRYTQLTPDPVTGPVDYLKFKNDCGNYLTRGYTPSLSHVLIGTKAALTADAVGASGGGQGDLLYLIDTRTAAIELASVDENGVPFGPTAQLGAGGPFHHMRNVVSEGGGAVYFQKSDAGGLLRRDVEAGETVAIGSGKSVLLDASRDGRYAFLVDDAGLVAEDTNGAEDVYRWDALAPDGAEYTLISVDAEPGDGSNGTNLFGLDTQLGASQSGDRLYFQVRDNQLVDGAPIRNGTHWYLWDRGTLKYVGTDIDRGGQNSQRRFHTNASASHFAHQSRQSVTFSPGDSPADVQIWVYDAEASTPTEPDLRCASCLPGGPAVTPWRGWFGSMDVEYQEVGATFYPDSMKLSMRVRVADDGAVLFGSSTPLLPEDINGPGQDYIGQLTGNVPIARQANHDAYLYRDGTLDLISSGRSAAGSLPLGISPDSRTIAFATQERLSAWDVDGQYDVYVARLAGGLPEPDRDDERVCEADDCQGAGASQQSLPQPGSDRPGGRGDVTPSARTTFSLATSSGALRRALAKGAASIGVRVSRPGVVTTVARARIDGTMRTVADAARRAARAGTLRLPLRLSRSARAHLSRTGRLRVTLSVRFTGARSPHALVLRLRRAR